MTTRLLESQVQRDAAWERAEDWICDVLDREGLTRARDVVGVRNPPRLDLVVDGRTVATVEIHGDLGQACGVSIASALLQRQSRGDCSTWHLRLSVYDEEVGAELLIREWRY